MKAWQPGILGTALLATVTLTFAAEFGEHAPADTPKMTLSELVKNPDAYKGKMLLVEGTLGDVCSDGDDFYFKDKFDLIEVVPPRGKDLPYKEAKGKPITVYGKVLVRHRGDETDVRMEAAGVTIE